MLYILNMFIFLICYLNFDKLLFLTKKVCCTAYQNYYSFVFSFILVLPIFLISLCLDF